MLQGSGGFLHGLAAAFIYWFGSVNLLISSFLGLLIFCFV